MSTQGPSPLPRSLHSMVVIKNRLFALGGWVPVFAEDGSLPSHETEWRCTNSLTCLNLGETLIATLASTCSTIDHSVYHTCFISSCLLPLFPCQIRGCGSCVHSILIVRTRRRSHAPMQATLLLQSARGCTSGAEGMATRSGTVG